MNKHGSFESERLIFRGINEQDADCLVKWRSNPEFYKYFKKPAPITKENHIEWYKKKYLNDPFRFDYIIIDKASGRKIGYVGVSNLNINDKTFEVNYIIGEVEFQRRGFASESIITIVDLMFSEGFLTAYAEIHKDNFASIKTVQKIQFYKFSEQGDFIKFARKYNEKVL